MRRSRRRWSAAAIAFLLAAVSGFLIVDRRYALVDWIAVSPSIVLVQFVEEPTPASRLALMSAPLDWRRRIAAEMWDRYAAGELSLRVRRAMTERQFESNLCSIDVESRIHWPKGETVHVDVTGHFGGPFPRELLLEPLFDDGRGVSASHEGWLAGDQTQKRSMRQSIGTPPGEGETIVFRAIVSEGGQELWRGRVEVPLIVRGSIEEVLEPLSSRDLDDDLRDSFAQCALSRDGRWLIVRPPIDARLNDVTLGVTCEILRDGNVIGRSIAHIPAPWQNPGEYQFVSRFFRERLLDELWVPVKPMPPNQSGDLAEQALPPGGNLAVRVRGDASVVLRDFSATRYWAGEVTVPLRIEE